MRKGFESHGTIVDINLKQKDGGIVFAFIEFDSVESAQRAVDAYSNFYRMKFAFRHSIFALEFDYLAWTKRLSLTKNLRFNSQEAGEKEITETEEAIVAIIMTVEATEEETTMVNEDLEKTDQEDVSTVEKKATLPNNARNV